MPAGLLVSEFFTKALPAGGGRAKKALARAVVETAANADFPSLMLTAAKAYAAAPPEAWAAAPGRLAGIMDSLSRTRMPGAGEADIWPGRRHKLPVGDFEWAMYLPLPAVSARARARDGNRAWWFGLLAVATAVCAQRACVLSLFPLPFLCYSSNDVSDKLLLRSLLDSSSPTQTN